MGCGASTAVSEADKAALAKAQFTAIPPVWSGIAAMPAGTINANGTTIEDAAGMLILNVAKDKAVHMALSHPTTGQVVMLVHKPDLGNLFTGKSSTWKIHSATAQAGQEPETASSGVAMYKFGSFEQKPRKEGTLDYLDSSGAVVMTAKLSGYTCKVFGPDGASLAAVVTGISQVGECKGTCTFANGADPIVALAMAVSLMSVSG